MPKLIQILKNQPEFKIWKLKLKKLKNIRDN